MMDTYIKITYNGYRLKVLADYACSELVDICCREQLDEGQNCHQVHSSLQACVHRIKFQDHEYYHKTFYQRSKFEPLKNYLNGSRATRSLRGHLLLRQNGFGAPKVIMIGHRGKHNFMISEAVDDALDLYQYIDRVAKLNGPDFRQKKLEIIKEVAKFVGKMHAKKIIHGDLRWGNLLITKDDAGKNSFWLIDNERTFKYPILPAVRRLKNLVQLNMTIFPAVTRADRLRFFMQYLQENSCIKSTKRKWIRMIANKTSKRLRRKNL
ncbi:MAG: hypothetical protein KAU22_05410 [Desulfuromonadales bacterium]|nr:hypothetical protein [Desulfuromonadales bacterium]